MEKETRLSPLTWPYVSPCPGQIPIVASTIFPEFYKIYPTRENYVEAVDAGIRPHPTNSKVEV